MAIQVAVFEPHRAVLELIVARLGTCPDIELLTATTQWSELLLCAQELNFDVVVMAIGIPTEGFSPETAIRSYLEAHPNTKIIAISSFDRKAMVRYFFTVGVKGYLLKGDDFNSNLLAGLWEVYEGKRYVSPTLRSLFSSFDAG